MKKLLFILLAGVGFFSSQSYGAMCGNNINIDPYVTGNISALPDANGDVTINLEYGNLTGDFVSGANLTIATAGLTDIQVDAPNLTGVNYIQGNDQGDNIVSNGSWYNSSGFSFDLGNLVGSGVIKIIGKYAPRLQGVSVVANINFDNNSYFDGSCYNYPNDIDYTNNNVFLNNYSTPLANNLEVRKCKNDDMSCHINWEEWVVPTVMIAFQDNNFYDYEIPVLSGDKYTISYMNLGGGNSQGGNLYSSGVNVIDELPAPSCITMPYSAHSRNTFDKTYSNHRAGATFRNQLLEYSKDGGNTWTNINDIIIQMQNDGKTTSEILSTPICNVTHIRATPINNYSSYNSSDPYNGTPGNLGFNQGSSFSYNLLSSQSCNQNIINTAKVNSSSSEYYQITYGIIKNIKTKILSTKNINKKFSTLILDSSPEIKLLDTLANGLYYDDPQEYNKDNNTSQVASQNPNLNLSAVSNITQSGINSGDFVKYELKIKNNGIDDQVILTGMFDVNFSGQAIGLQNLGSGNNYIYDLGTILSGEEKTINFEGQIFGNPGTSIINTYSVQGTNKCDLPGEIKFDLNGNYSSSSSSSSSFSNTSSSSEISSSSVSSSSSENSSISSIENSSFSSSSVSSTQPSASSSSIASSVSSSSSSSISALPIVYGGGGGGGWINYSSSSAISISSNVVSSSQSVHNAASSSSVVSDPESVGAYEWAKKIGLTSQPTYETFEPYGPLLRKHLAKYISIFATQVLNYKPVYNQKCRQFSDIKDESNELQNYIIESCELGMMGLWSDGVTVNDEFWPNRQVPRAEFGSALSRLLYGTKYASYKGDPQYYVPHLNALKANGIMNQIEDPWIIERRAWVVLMFQRYSQKFLNK